MALSPAERTQRARIAALALHAQGGTSTSAATAASMARFEREVDPDGALTPEERARRADFAKRRYFASLAYKASRKRSRDARPPQDAAS